MNSLRSPCHETRRGVCRFEGQLGVLLKPAPQYDQPAKQPVAKPIWHERISGFSYACMTPLTAAE